MYLVGTNSTRGSKRTDPLRTACWPGACRGQWAVVTVFYREKENEVKRVAAVLGNHHLKTLGASALF